MLEFRKDNPWRPVNWRWERARARKEGKMRGIPVKNEDPYVLAACKFQQALDRCRDDTDRYFLLEKNPDLYDAYALRRPNADGSTGGATRWAMEARILAGETTAAVAAKLGCSAALVEWYERLFFNVTERRRAADYIMTAVIGPAIYAGTTEREYDILWKVFGYMGGPDVLDSFIHLTTRRAKVAGPGEVNEYFDNLTRSNVGRKAAVCSQLFQINGFTQESMMNIYTTFVKLEQDRDQGGQIRDTLVLAVQAGMNNLPWANGEGVVRPDLPSGSRPMDQKLLLGYDQDQVELRTDELLAVSSGRELPDRAELQSIRFPEPANANTPPQ